MVVLRKILVLLLALTLVLGGFTSCDDQTDGEGGTEQSGTNNGGDQTGTGEELSSDKYLASVKVSYSSNDSKMNEALSALRGSFYSIKADKDKLLITCNAEVGDVIVDREYLYIDGTLYHTTQMMVDGMNVSVNEKANASEEDVDKLIGEIGTGANITKGDFLKIDRESLENGTKYSCSKMSDASKESLARVLSADLGSIGATVTVEDATYMLTVISDRDVESSFSCNLNVAMKGVNYYVTMTVVIEYDYEASFSLSAPANTEVYSDVSLDDIIG